MVVALSDLHEPVRLLITLERPHLGDTDLFGDKESIASSGAVMGSTTIHHWVDVVQPQPSTSPAFRRFPDVLAFC